MDYDLLIRPALRTDITPALDVYTESFTRPKLDPTDRMIFAPYKMSGVLSDALSAADICLFKVAEMNKKLEGFIISYFYQDRAQIYNFHTRPSEYETGTALLHHLEENLWDLGVRQLNVVPTSGSTPIYRRYGFRSCDRSLDMMKILHR